MLNQRSKDEITFIENKQGSKTTRNLVLKIIKAALAFTHGNDTYTYIHVCIYTYI